MTEPTPTPYTAPAAAPARPTNVLSIIALIGGFLIPLAGIIVGFIALSQIKKTGENGRGLAIAGIIIGFVVGALEFLLVVASFLLPFLFASSFSTYGY